MRRLASIELQFNFVPFHSQATILLVITFIPCERTKLRYLYNFGPNFIYAKSEVSPRNHDVCDKIAINLLTCSIRVNLLVLLSYTLAAGAPLYNTLYTDKKEMIIPVLLPFIDPDTPNGFAVNYAYQMITCIFGSFIVPGIELLACVLRNNVSVTAAVIENAIREFRIRLRRERKFCPDLAWEFRNILFKILDFDGFVFQQNKLCK